MSIQYLPQGIPIISSSVATSGSYAVSIVTANRPTTSSLAAHSLHAIGLTGSNAATSSAQTSLVSTGSQGLTILVITTGSSAFLMATSSFNLGLAGSNVGQIDPSASYGGGVGYNPTLNLISGKQYRFLVRGGPPSLVQSTFRVTNAGSGAYTFDIGAVGNNPTLTLIRGYRYEFNIEASGHPFWIQTSVGGYNSGNVYNTGVSNNGTQVGRMQFIVPHNAPNTLYYYCQFHPSMGGQINIIDDGLYGFGIYQSSASAATPVSTGGITNNNIKSGSLTYAVSASAPTTLYYFSPDNSAMRGRINIVSG